jgi:carbon-monoxide dehydrogenase small subunit
MRYSLTLVVDDVSYELSVEPDRSLLAALRYDLGLTGTKEGCDDSECGACMILMNGRPVNACSFLALQAAGQQVTTVQGLARDGQPNALQRAFLDEGGVQCGFCTPGMLMSATALLDANPHPTDEQIRSGLAGNLCRCTGYQKIISAVARAAAEA